MKLRTHLLLLFVLLFSAALMAMPLAAAVRYPRTNPSQTTRARHLRRLPKVPAAAKPATESTDLTATKSATKRATTPIIAAPSNQAETVHSQQGALTDAPVVPATATTTGNTGAEARIATTVPAAADAKSTATATVDQPIDDAPETDAPGTVAEKSVAEKSAPDQESADSAPSHGADTSAAAAAPGATPSQTGTDVDAPTSPDGQLRDTATATKPSPPQPPSRQFTRGQIALRNKLRACLRDYYQHPESTTDHSPWGIMHALVGLGVDTDILVGRRRVNAIGWLCWNQPCRGMQLLTLNDGIVVPRQGPGYQGHQGQLLAMLAQSRVRLDYAIRVDNQDLTVADLVKYEMTACRPRSELTFQLIGLAHYLKSDAKWTSQQDQQWSIPRLIQEEITQPINGACCGGTHRLMGLSVAVHTREKRNEPVNGQWLRAKNFVLKYQQYALRLQNRDGSFSTDWFKRRADSGDVDRKIQTSGHILEWLIYSLPEQQLDNRQVVGAVNFIANTLTRRRGHEWEIGPHGHAIRALALYNERVFGDKPGQRQFILTSSQAN